VFEALGHGINDIIHSTKSFIFGNVNIVLKSIKDNPLY